MYYLPKTKGAWRGPTTGVVREVWRGKVRPTQGSPRVHDGTALKEKNQHRLGNNEV